MIHKSYIAGVKHRPGAQNVLNRLDRGTLLTLVCDPDNRFDRFAVKIVYSGVHLGFVPRDLSAEVSALIGQSRVTACKLISGSQIEIHFD